MAVQSFLPGKASPFADLLVRTIYLRVSTKEVDLFEKRLPSTGGGGTLASLQVSIKKHARRDGEAAEHLH